MGTWGPGNLDNDSGGDFLGNYIDSLGQIIDGLVSSKENTLKVFHDNYDEVHIMVLIEIIIALCEKFETCFIFQQNDVERWRDIYLEAFDEYALDARYGSFADERRPVIEETFEKMRQIVIEYNK
jgi:hypothetical protein